MSYLLSPEDSKKRDAGCVHHLDHDHFNNDIDNLVGMHYGCHTAYHRSVRPLVEAGSTLPEQWRANIAKAIAKRMEDPAARARLSESVSKTKARVSAEDGMLTCGDCGREFKSRYGLGHHRGLRGACSKNVDRDKLQADWEFECSCGKKFSLKRGMKRHLSNNDGHVAVKTALSASEKSAIAYAEAMEASKLPVDCSCGFKAKNQLSLRTHRRWRKCA